MTAPGPRLLQLKILLRDVHPAVWRRDTATRTRKLAETDVHLSGRVPRFGELLYRQTRLVMVRVGQSMQLPYAVRGTGWIIVYLFFILAPLFALLTAPLPPARDFWTEFSAALGYAGLAMMGLQFGLTARFRYVTEPWGEDVIYHFHRQISLIAVGLVVAHPLILFAVRPELLALLNFIQAPWRARFAAMSTYSLIAIVVMSLWRVKLKIKYETWHLTHIVLAVVAVTAGIAHMIGWGFYLVYPWKRALWISMTVFWLGLLFYIRLVKP